MSFMVNEEHENIWSKYSEIWDRIKKVTVQDFDIEAIDKWKYITIKIKSNRNKNKSDFHDKALTPEQTPCLTHLLILTDSVYKSDTSYYLQASSEECE